MSLKSDGSLWAWGENTYGQLGAGYDSLVPKQIGTGYIAIAASYLLSAAIKADGSLWVWGNNSYGQLGDGSLLSTTSPENISSGYLDTLAPSVPEGLKASPAGPVEMHLSWDAAKDELGIAGYRVYRDAVLVGSPSGQNYIDTGVAAATRYLYTLAACDLTGNCSAQGAPISAITPAPDVTPPTTPTRLIATPLSPTWINLSWDSATDDVGVTLYQLYRNGSLLASPTTNHFSDTGLAVDSAFSYTVAACDGSGNCSAPANVITVRTSIVTPVITVGGRHAACIRIDGSLWSWGENYSGQLGDGSYYNYKNFPQRIGRVFTSVAAGFVHTLALKSDGSLWSWGNNDYGQLGLGGYRYSPDFVNTSAILLSPGEGYTTLASGAWHSLAIKSDGTLWAWGRNNTGQLGIGNTQDQTGPMQVGADYMAVSAGELHTLAIKKDGSLWAWGYNYSGQLGDGSSTDRYSPVQIGTGYSAVAGGAFHSVALQSDGSLWAWGAGTSLGDDSTPDVNAPLKIGDGFVAIAAGTAHSVALKADGSVWIWGSNTYGQLGDGTTQPQARPQLIGSGFSAIAAGDRFTLALATNGDLWSWGANESGQLGDGTLTERHSQVQPLGANGVGKLNVLDISEQKLALNNAGGGTVSLGSVSCNADCTLNFSTGAVVTLIASPVNGFVFNG